MTSQLRQLLWRRAFSCARDAAAPSSGISPASAAMVAACHQQPLQGHQIHSHSLIHGQATASQHPGSSISGSNSVHSSWATPAMHISTSSASTSAAGNDGSLGNNRIQFTPISKAVALLVSHDPMRDRHRIVEAMSKLCIDMANDITIYSPTEVAAFCEAAKKLDFCTQSLADAVMEYFHGKVDQLNEEELLGVVWVVAKKEDVDSLLARDLGEAINNHLESLRHEDMPDALVLSASICPASPFLLTAIADEAMSRLAEFSASEVSALVSAFGSEIVRRSLFDDHIFKELATHVIKSVRNFSQAELRSVLAVYRDVCPRRHSLVPTLALMEDELAPYVSPSPQ